MHQFSLKYGQWAGDGSSRAIGRQPTWCSVWFSQWQINAAVPFSCVPAGAHVCLGIAVYLSLSFVYIPVINFSARRQEAAIHFPVMSRRLSMSGESKQSQDSGWSPESRHIAIGWSLLPFYKDGKMCLQHPPQSCSRAHSWGKEGTKPLLWQWFTFRARIGSGLL